MEIISLDDLFEFIPGVTKLPKNYKDNGKVFLINYKDVLMSSLIWEPNQMITIYENLDYTKHITRYNDLLITSTSEIQSEIGQISIYKSNKSALLNGFCKIMRLKLNNKLNPQYAFYLFKTDIFRKKISNCSNGITRYNILWNLFKKISFKLVNIEYQLDIIAIIEPFERLLEITNKKIELLIKLGDKLIELVKNECYLKNLSNITAGSSPPQFPEYWENGNIPFLNIKDLTNTPIITKVDSFITDLAFKKYNCKKIDKYSVLIGKVSPDKDKISLSTIDSVVNGAIRIIKPFQKENAFQLFFALRNKSDYIKKIATGSVQQQINSNQLYNLLIKFDTKMNNYFILLFKLLFILEKIKNKLKSIIRNIVKIYVK